MIVSAMVFLSRSVTPLLTVMRESMEMAAGGRLLLWQATDPLDWSRAEKQQE